MGVHLDGPFVVLNLQCLPLLRCIRALTLVVDISILDQLVGFVLLKVEILVLILLFLVMVLDDAKGPGIFLFVLIGSADGVKLLRDWLLRLVFEIRIARVNHKLLLFGLLWS